MKASRCSFACTARLGAALMAAVLLVQCSMPPEQAWRYIQTNGLLSYWGGSARQPSPPFRAGASSRYQGYAAYPQRQPSYAYRSSGLPYRSRYGTQDYATNRYFTSPSSAGTTSPRYIPRSRPSPPSVSRSTDRIPVEEPRHEPQVTTNSAPVTPAPKISGSSSSPAAAPQDLPYGSPVPGRLNMVNSPYAGKTQLVDVSGMSAGQTVKCPYTGKLFKVPPTQQAANHSDSRLESKNEAPKLSDEPKGGDKKP